MKFEFKDVSLELAVMDMSAPLKHYSAPNGFRQIKSENARSNGKILVVQSNLLYFYNTFLEINFSELFYGNCVFSHVQFSLYLSDFNNKLHVSTTFGEIS